MKLTFENARNHQYTFGELKRGDMFTYGGDDTPEVYMVLGEEYGLGSTVDYDGYAVNLNSGEIFGFDNDETIVRVDIEAKVYTMFN